MGRARRKKGGGEHPVGWAEEHGTQALSSSEQAEHEGHGSGASDPGGRSAESWEGKVISHVGRWLATMPVERRQSMSGHRVMSRLLSAS